MPQAIPAVAAFAASSAVEAAAATFATAIMINVVIGAMEFRDADGELWVAIDE